jgi:hypothetical protein
LLSVASINKKFAFKLCYKFDDEKRDFESINFVLLPEIRAGGTVFVNCGTRKTAIIDFSSFSSESHSSSRRSSQSNLAEAIN